MPESTHQVATFGLKGLDSGQKEGPPRLRSAPLGTLPDLVLEFFVTERHEALTGCRRPGFPMRTADMKRYKNVLLGKRQDLTALPVRSTVADETMRTGDWVDHSSQENDLHVNLALNQTDTKLLRAIDEALHRIEKGTFGVCMDCEETIPNARLDAVPWTRVCVSCKERKD
jgi:DnaK suppressor protein